MAENQHSYKPCVLYTLPKDVTTQAIGEKTIENALNKVSIFLNLFSDKKDIDFYTLDAHIPQPHEKYYAAGLKNIEEAKSLFGAGVEESIGYSYPQGRPLPQRRIKWEFDTDKTSLYLDFILRLQPIPSFELPLFELIGIVYFNLTNYNAGVLSNQTNLSSLMVWLGRNSAISPAIWLPFADLNNEFYDYKDEFAKYYPGRFNDKYLRKVKPIKDGTAYQVRKL